jgi:hypothetical protein
MRLKISTQALDDHQERLYESNESTDTIKVHVDGYARFTIIKRTKTVTTVEMETAAITEFLSDADYYDECMEEDMLPVGKMFARAAASVRKQILRGETK